MTSNLFVELQEKLEGKKVRIVFPEAYDERILEAAVKLSATSYVQPVLIGKKEEVEKIAQPLFLNVSGIEFIDHENYEKYDEMLAKFIERRAGKVTEEKAHVLLKDVNYFGTMLVYMGEVAGLVSGAIHSTGDTVRPALQIIKTKPGVSRTSGAFIMSRNASRFIFADCAINTSLDAQALAEIAVESAKTAKAFNINPKVAMLSFSTMGSAVTPETEKVAEATKLVREKAPTLPVGGELQFDAAFVPPVAKLKAPNSEIQGDATVFIFPSLEAGNIGYKIAQRLGGFEAVGPILQGLNAPVNDLSRGCSTEDVLKLALITATQSLAE
ncbi:Phosphate acetyltransferase [Gemella morbillorum]|mgnify:FL=1|jgi:phosphate acetyltransferase|uniref:Phosphate acetyltransferase n=1 Tax=Gemella morbillorum TaxID=29391 RepID=A0A2X4NIA6_9BACL|nr:phosphate acetyltransferase [Gemella morbillorum]EFV35674.1 phosphate acetyl/butaryl transferase [Gemella morbillorum M424]MBF1209192.1 phosphate acetyltransferase [Gemella morbillorum]MDK8240256.1 phosphate acetyltransferase [Gemella morbillorum]MDK8254816.1 phosphate acetyltransferase [Gemella morbillorum]QGS08386.1 phosphate acetyltransferase [Gemella morbillorum]